MTSTPPPVPPNNTIDGPLWQVPLINREERLLSGTSAAIAREVGVDVRWVRLAWILLFAVGGWGALLYVATWGTIAWLNYTGRPESSNPHPKGKSESHRTVGFWLVVIGMIGLNLQLGGLPPAVMWPLAIAAFGLLLAWRRLGPTAVRRSEGRYPLAQAIAGLVLAALGAALLVFFIVGVNTSAVLYAVIGILAIAVVATAPWWWQVVQELDQERQARVRSDERAAVAAHLHDSVLQTLTLIQRNSDDPQTMLSLARRQERELRNWLDPDRVSRQGGSVRGRLDELASEVEELYHVPVEVVVSGDCLVDQPIDEALSAVREALVNAAKHSKADRVDVYAESRPDALEIYVRDRGAGFDREQIAADRRGIANSIEARMTRAGGQATIVSTLGEGTEVELVLPRQPESSS